MNRQHILKTGLLAAFSLGLSVAQGATLTLTDGSRIEGTLKKIHEGTVFFETGFAGTLEIPQKQVSGLETMESVSLRTESGEVFQGPVTTSAPGGLTINSSAGAINAEVDNLVSGWQSGDRDPVQVARESELENQIRKWAYAAGFDVSGSDGNSENFASSLAFEAKLEGPNDRLLLYGSYKYKETEGIRAEDEQKGGIRYTNFFTEKMGWFVREELERDTFEGIDFRSTSAAGLTYRFIKQERLTLEGSAGLSYRYESYGDSSLESDGFPGLDFSLDLGWQFADWGKLVSHLSYLPSIDDFGDYLIEHESGVDVPLGTSDNWVMRFGLKHQYNSNPNGNREKLDTSYFARLILSWD